MLKKYLRSLSLPLSLTASTTISTQAQSRRMLKKQPKKTLPYNLKQPTVRMSQPRSIPVTRCLRLSKKYQAGRRLRLKK